MKKKAFTMIELVFVIIVMGILAVAIIPKLNDTTLEENIIKFISHVRYTQHLSMTNDVYMSTDANWYDYSYCIDLNNSTWDINKKDEFGNKTTAKDTLDNNKFMHVELKNTTFTIVSTKQFNRLCFDNMGRPFINSLKLNNINIIHDRIVIDFTHGDKTARVEIEQETGYIHKTN